MSNTNDTTSTFRTEQEVFWAGEFGNAYVSRNRGDAIIASNCALFAKILQRTNGVRSVVELGANIGLNLAAIHLLHPNVSCTGVEINPTAINELAARPYVQAIHASIFDWPPLACDLAFFKGVLIHINPDMLPVAYEKLYKASRRYVMICEYYNPSPVDIEYRGHTGRLFKRDFAGEFLDKYQDFRLVDYGFVYRRDPVFPQDDCTWFLMEKQTT